MTKELAEVRQPPTVLGRCGAIGALWPRQDHMEDMMLIALVQERIDALEVAQHRCPTAQTEADLHVYRAIAARLLARIRKRQARSALISRLTAIANLRLHWRIWRRPLAVPEPEEIATDI